MNELQRRSLSVCWKVELFLAGGAILGVANGDPVMTVCALAGMVWLGWLFHKDWKGAKGHDDCY